MFCRETFWVVSFSSTCGSGVLVSAMIASKKRMKTKLNYGFLGRFLREVILVSCSVQFGFIPHSGPLSACQECHDLTLITSPIILDLGVGYKSRTLGITEMVYVLDH